MRMRGKLQRIEDFVQNRRDICNSCEHKKVVIGANICDKCGCSIWAKSMIPAFKCPIGKWDAK
jgi:hypothetical protein